MPLWTLFFFSQCNLLQYNYLCFPPSHALPSQTLWLPHFTIDILCPYPNIKTLLSSQLAIKDTTPITSYPSYLFPIFSIFFLTSSNTPLFRIFLFSLSHSSILHTPFHNMLRTNKDPLRLLSSRGNTFSYLRCFVYTMF